MPAISLRVRSSRPAGRGAARLRRVLLVLGVLLLAFSGAARAQVDGKAGKARAAAARSAAGKLGSARIAGNSRRARAVARLRSARTSLGQTRVVVSAGVRTGLVVVAGTGSDVGVVLRPKAEAKKSGVKRLAAYQSVGGNIGPLGGKGYLGTDRQLRGFEYNVGPASRRSPVHGDKIGVPVIPGILSISASRKGGLGLHVSALPLPVGGYPLVWGNASVYVGHPKLAPVSNKVLDTAEAVGRRVVRGAERLRRVARPVTKHFAPMAGAARRTGRAVGRSLLRIFGKSPPERGLAGR